MFFYICFDDFYFIIALLKVLVNNGENLFRPVFWDIFHYAQKSNPFPSG